MKSMMTLAIAAILSGSFLETNATAQDRGDRRDRGDRGDRDRSFGSFPGNFGGPSGSFGGPPGGFSGPPGGFGGGFSGGFGGGPPGGFGGDRGERGSRFGSMMDSNGNGKIDQEEIDRMPSFVRDIMKARGVELKAGISVDDMRNSFRNSMTSPPGTPPNENSGNSGGNSTAKTLTPYKMKPKKPLTLSLPPAFSEVDTDFDGQIGLYEWLMTRRIDLDQFDAMDLNEDGYLTPEELLAAETAATNANPVAAAERKRLLIVSATPARATSAAPGSPQNTRDSNSRGGWGGGDVNTMAAESFRRLDNNGDGFIDNEEWQQSRRTRGMFEQAGIRLDRMNLDQFTQHYVRLNGGSNR